MRAIVLVLLPLSLLSTGCLRRTLLTGLTESEAREVAVALHKGGVRPYVEKQASERREEGAMWKVEIHGGDRTQVDAWQVLQENALPRTREQGIEDVYKAGQLIPTASEERAKFLLALSGELSRSLKTIPGVVDARVHIVIPDSMAVRDPSYKPHPTASVLLKIWADYAEPQRSEVVDLIAKGVEGLDKNEISVMVTKLKTTARNEPTEFVTALRPTVGFVLDYVYYAGWLAAMVFAVWAAFHFAPPLVRWVRTQAMELFRSIKAA